MNFSRNDTINQRLEQFLSRTRLEKYLEAVGNLDSALTLYESNSRLSEAFYIPLQYLEVCLGNALNAQLAQRYGEDWMMNGEPPFDRNTAHWLQETVDNIGGLNGGKSYGHVVAELKFAFWVSLLAKRYDGSLWRQCLHRAFLARGGKPRGQVYYGRINALRRFRNRVAHHEPIFQKDLDLTHREILEAIEWVCPDTSKWTASLSRYESVKNSI